MINLLSKAFGRNPSGEQLEKLRTSPHFHEGVFHNAEPTEMLSSGSLPGTLLKFLTKPANTRPARPLPVAKADLKNLPRDKVSLVWFGHSSYLICHYGFNILVDPVFSGHASPFKFAAQSFPGANAWSVDDLPEIDLLLLTHDHYDHLDYETVLQLRPRVKRIVTSLGVSSHLLYWGFDAGRITELDWLDSFDVGDGITFTAHPARHFSGRTMQRFRTFWSAFILKTPHINWYLGGDSGYGTHFKQAGLARGPFDVAILECGQYNEAWHHIHMMPEETAEAARDLMARTLVPVHWGKFSLALHPWNEPVERLLKHAPQLGIRLAIPMLGQPVSPAENADVSPWWRGSV